MVKPGSRSEVSEEKTKTSDTRVKDDRPKKIRFTPELIEILVEARDWIDRTSHYKSYMTPESRMPGKEPVWKPDGLQAQAIAEKLKKILAENQ